MKFSEVATSFVSEIAQLPSVNTMRAGIITANSVTISDIILSKDDYNTELAPLLRKYTNNFTTAQLLHFKATEQRKTVGQTYYYQVQLIMNQEEK